MHHQTPEAPGFGILKQLQPRRNPRKLQLPALFTQPGPKADPHLRHFWARGPWGPNAYGSPSSPSGCGTAAVSCRRFSADFAKQLERVAQDYDVLADPLGFGRDGKQRV